MKRTFLIVLASVLLFLLFGASNVKPQPAPRKHCHGYRVIEAGVGIDCHGDTIVLSKTHGFYQPV